MPGSYCRASDVQQAHDPLHEHKESQYVEIVIRFIPDREGVHRDNTREKTGAFGFGVILEADLNPEFFRQHQQALL